MIRGPRRGLGTFRCRCCRSWNHWSTVVSLLVLLSLPLLLLQPCQAASPRVPHLEPSARATSTKGSANQTRLWSSTASVHPTPGADFPSLHRRFQQDTAPFTRSSGAMSAMSNSGSSSSRDSTSSFSSSSSISSFGIQHHLQHQHAIHSGSGYKHPTSSLGTTAEESIIRLMSKRNMYLQIFPNGTVGTTTQDSSIYTILEQSAVQVGQVYIRGVASRQYLCLNSCGKLYGSSVRTADCILHENIEENWYNTYTSVKYSTDEKSLYVAVSLTGEACRLRLKSVMGSDGRPTVALGTNEKFTQFFPVRNISLPKGGLTSLTQNASNFKLRPVEPNDVGCAPRCKKPSNQLTSHTRGNSQIGSVGSGKDKSKSKSRRNKCPCQNNEMPAQGGGTVERCRRPRHCRHSYRPSTTSISKSSNRSHQQRGISSTQFNGHQSHHHQSPNRSLEIHNKRNKDQDQDWENVKGHSRVNSSKYHNRIADGRGALIVSHRATSAEMPSAATSKSNSRSRPMTWKDLEQSHQIQPNKKNKSMIQEHERHHGPKQRKKQKDRRKIVGGGLKVRHSRGGHAGGIDVETGSKSTSAPTKMNDGAPLLLTTSSKLQGRFRHMYRKIRAHPGLFTSEQL